MSALRYVLVLAAVALPFAVTANEVDEKPIGEAVERHLSLDAAFMQWVQDPDRVDDEISDTIEIGFMNSYNDIKLPQIIQV